MSNVKRISIFLRENKRNFQNGDLFSTCVAFQSNSISFRLHLTRKSMQKRNNNDEKYDKTINKVANKFIRSCCMNGACAAACFGAHATVALIYTHLDKMTMQSVSLPKYIVQPAVQRIAHVQ